MDPVTLALLAGTGAVGGAQALGSMFKTPQEKHNEEELRKLQQRQERGRLGLTGRERRVAQQSLLDPVREALSGQQNRNEALAAATGQSSGAQMARLREESQRAMAGATQRAAGQVTAADLAKQQAEEQEIEARVDAIQQARTARRNQMFKGLSGVAGAVGGIAGAPPEALRATGLFGSAIRDTDALRQKLADAGVAPEDVEAVIGLGPRRLTTLLRNLDEGRIGPEEAELAALLDMEV